MVNELKEKRNSLSDLRQRIHSCSRSSSSFQEMQLQVNQMKKEGAVDAGVMEEYEKLKIVVDQQKLQLQSDVHFIIERDTPFVEHAFDIVLSTCKHERVGAGDDAALHRTQFRASHARASEVPGSPGGTLCGGEGGFRD